MILASFVPTLGQLILAIFAQLKKKAPCPKQIKRCRAFTASSLHSTTTHRLLAIRRRCNPAGQVKTYPTKPTTKGRMDCFRTLRHQIKERHRRQSWGRCHLGLGKRNRVDGARSESCFTCSGILEAWCSTVFVVALSSPAGRNSCRSLKSFCLVLFGSVLIGFVFTVLSLAHVHCCLNLRVRRNLVSLSSPLLFVVFALRSFV
jgi:hypothetical protein